MNTDRKRQNRIISQLSRQIAARDRYHGKAQGILEVLGRYWHLAFAGHLTPRKLANIVLAHAEMALGIAKVRSKPYMLRIEPTNICNLSCPGCATGLGLDRREKGFISVEKYEKLVRSLAPWTLIIRIDGLGEPFLHRDLCELVRIANKNGIATALSSHLGPGTQVADRAEEIVLSGLDHLIVSIDGPDAASYAEYRRGGDFELTCRNVRKLIDQFHANTIAA